MPKRAVGIENSGKSVPLSMRTTPELRKRLEESANLRGWSLAQEVEARVRGSFDRGDMVDAVEAAMRRVMAEKT